jgi:glycosyltransferase involved in cell wall biosynthesis
LEGIYLLSSLEYEFFKYKITRNKYFNFDPTKIDYPYEKDLVSIILPVYNGEKTISATIKSILKQSYKNFELIIVDDGSTDKTPAMLQKFKEADTRISVITQDNLKLPKALSKGFSLAKGEFHTWISADNIVHDNFIKELVEYLKGNKQVSMAYANMNLIDEYGNKIKYTTWYPWELDPSVVALPKSTFYLNVYPNNFIGAAFLYRGLVTQILGDYAEDFFTVEDYDYWMRINELLELKHISSDLPLYDYRFHSNSLTSKYSSYYIAAKRDELIALDTARRSFLLSKTIWIFDNDITLFSELKDLLISAGHIFFNRSQILLYSSKLPMIYIKYYKENSLVTKFNESFFKVLILKNLKDIIHIDLDSWDCIITLEKQTSLPKLEAYKGVFYIEDSKNLFSFIDMKCKNKLFKKHYEKPEVSKVIASIIIPCKNEADNLKWTIDSIEAAKTYVTYEIIVVDDASTDGSTDFLMDKKNITLIKTTGVGCAGARNEGARLSSGKYLIFCDAHIKVENYWLESLLSTLKYSEADLMVPCISDINNPISKGYGVTWDSTLQFTWLLKNPMQPSEIPLAGAACLCITKEAFSKIHGFNPVFKAYGMEDQELCLKAWLFGFRLLINPDVTVYHLFRTTHPYKVEASEIIYNTLCLAYCHFNKARIEKTIDLLNKNIEFSKAASELQNNLPQILALREIYFKERSFDEDYYFKKFNIDY